MAENRGCNAPNASGVELLRRATHVELSHKAPGSFSLLLQGGFYSLVQVGAVLKDVLHENLGIPEGYANQRIRSVFLNGSRVSVMEKASISGDSRLSLSSGNPGFLKAVLGKKKRKKAAQESRFVRVRGHSQEYAALQVHLLQSTASDLTTCVLRQGVYIGREKFMTFLALRPEAFFEGLKGARLDGFTVPVKQSHLSEWLMCTRYVHLSLSEKNAVEDVAA
jgi:hypothetical protein